MKKTIPLLIALTFGATASFANEDKIAELQAQLNALADYVESQSVTPSKTSLGGYGEMHYNNRSNGSNELDFHRFILFVNHEFSDNIKLFSELELEHAIAGVGQVGAIELEQAFLQFEKGFGTIKVGIFLMPVGIVNETHEPPTFYGTERNPVEKYIIPTTWREGGVMYSANSAGGLSWDIAVHSGLNTTTSVRAGRQSVGNAVADTLAYTGRIQYTGLAGLTLSASLNQQEDMNQLAGGLGAATLLEGHVIYNIADLKLTALFARWTIENGQDTQGSVLEASYRFSPAWGVFTRQNTWDDTGAGDKVQYDIGANYWPHEDVVLKLDMQQQNTVAGNQDGFNLGVGYQF
ncbi:MAG: porin [Ghiorsea sp.]|nr:porin [Ghiorsea sp.]